MASFETRKDKDGNITCYRLTVCLGRDTSGKKLFKRKSIKKPDNFRTEKQIKKWINEEMKLFANVTIN